MYSKLFKYNNYQGWTLPTLAYFVFFLLQRLRNVHSINYQIIKLSNLLHRGTFSKECLFRCLISTVLSLYLATWHTNEKKMGLTQLATIRQTMRCGFITQCLRTDKDDRR